MICKNCNHNSFPIADVKCSICDAKWPHHEYFDISLDEAQILNQWLRLHHGLFKEQEGYIHLLRLINGLGNLVDKYDGR